MQCNVCGEQITKQHKFCPSCGSSISQTGQGPYSEPSYQSSPPKRIYRSRDDRVIAGVCAGFGKYFKTDPTIIRLLWIFAILFGGTGLLAYIIAAILIPEEPIQRTQNSQ